MSAGGQRIDKWLFFTRLAKTRGLAQDIVQAGAVRLNREKISQAARLVRPGDVLTLSLHGRVRIVKVKAPGLRRGPAAEAAELYEDLSPPAPPTGGDADGREASVVPSAGRPSRREREEAERLSRRGSE